MASSYNIFPVSYFLLFAYFIFLILISLYFLYMMSFLEKEKEGLFFNG